MRTESFKQKRALGQRASNTTLAHEKRDRAGERRRGKEGRAWRRERDKTEAEGWKDN